MKKLTLITAFLALALPAFALDPAPAMEVRVGWGDPMYESAVFYNSTQKNKYSYTGHFFAEYLHSISDWFGLGIQADVEGVYWNSAKSESRDNFHNISFFPTARFTYYRKGIVTMYSGIGLGLNINTGSETDYLGRRTVCSPLINITAYAISVNFTPNWFGTFEIGGLNALNGKQEFFMLGSRLLSISFGYRL